MSVRPQSNALLLVRPNASISTLSGPASTCPALAGATNHLNLGIIVRNRPLAASRWLRFRRTYHSRLPKSLKSKQPDHIQI